MCLHSPLEVLPKIEELYWPDYMHGIWRFHLMGMIWHKNQHVHSFISLSSPVVTPHQLRVMFFLLLLFKDFIRLRMQREISYITTAQIVSIDNLRANRWRWLNQQRDVYKKIEECSLWSLTFARFSCSRASLSLWFASIESAATLAFFLFKSS